LSHVASRELGRGEWNKSAGRIPCVSREAANGDGVLCFAQDDSAGNERRVGRQAAQEREEHAGANAPLT
jgi:hypothetical protein